MNVRKAIVTAIAGCALGLAAGQAMAVALCDNVATMGDWVAAGSCIQGDKLWTLTDRGNLLDGVHVDFTNPTPLTNVMAISNFDHTDAAFTWNLSYTIHVIDPKFFIAIMAAGADDTGGLGSLLHKVVTGDPTINPFALNVVNGKEDAGSIQAGLTATTLNVVETFHVNAGANLNSVSDSFIQRRLAAPEPGTLVLLGAGLIALGALRRKST